MWPATALLIDYIIEFSRVLSFKIIFKTNLTLPISLQLLLIVEASMHLLSSKERKCTRYKGHSKNKQAALAFTP